MQIKEIFNKFSKINGFSKEVCDLLLKLVNIIENREQFSIGHSERVAYYAKKVGHELGFSPQQLEYLELAGRLHDIGKISISDYILQKEGPLDPDERLIIRQHPLVSCEIIAPFSFLHPIIPAIKYHHERWDGSGYPDGLKGEEIPLEARILGVVDSFEALSSNRPYRKKLSVIKIFKTIEGNAGIIF